MAPKKETELTALATALPKDLETALLDDDGLGNVELTDEIGVPMYIFNRQEFEGVPVTKNMFCHCGTAEVMDSIHAVILAVQKGRTYMPYVKDASSAGSVLVCRSFDGVAGVVSEAEPDKPTFPGMRDGLDGWCDKCQHIWHGRGSRPHQDCRVTYRTFLWDVDRDMPGLISFWKTNAGAFSQYLLKHHLNKGPRVNGKKTNVATYRYGMTLELEMQQFGGGPAAVPVFNKPHSKERVPVVLDPDESKTEYGVTWPSLREMMTRHADAMQWLTRIADIEHAPPDPNGTNTEDDDPTAGWGKED